MPAAGFGMLGALAARGVHHVDATVADVVLSADDWVRCLRTTDGTSGPTRPRRPWTPAGAGGSPCIQLAGP